MDRKTGTVYKVKRVDGVMVILETDDGRNRILTVAGSMFRNRGLRFAIRNKKDRVISDSVSVL